jgi:hypothetical protein
MPPRKIPFIAKMGIVGRPVRPRFGDFMTPRPSILDRDQGLGPETLEDLYDVALHCNAVRKSVQSLRDQIFKEGWEWAPLYSRRCKRCRHEYPRGTKPEFCAECGFHDEFGQEGKRVIWYDEPDQPKEMDKFFKRVDRNGHTLVELLKMFEDHLNVADDGFLVVAQDYGLDQEGQVVRWSVRELSVPDPRNFKMIVDPQTMVPGGRFYVCLAHRPTLERDPISGATRSVGRVHDAPGACGDCGRRLHDVWYVSHEPGSKDRILEYYIEREVIHCSKYSIRYGYGQSPLISVYNMARLLMRMEEYVKTFYDEERTPRMAIFIPTKNPDSIRDAFKTAEDRNVSQGGHYVPKFTYDPGEGSQPVQVAEFSKLPECYRRIGSAFGVAPVFHGSMDAVGLQNSGPTQWAVTGLAAQWGQWTYNEKVLPRLLELFGVTDWVLSLQEPEEEDDQAKWQVRLMEVQHALSMTQLGFPPTGRDTEGHFEFPSQPQAQGGGSPGGAFGSMTGAGGGAPGAPPAPGDDAAEGGEDDDYIN